MRSKQDDSGASPVTMLILAPVLIMFIELIVVGGRFAAVQADMQSAAREGARQASISMSQSSAATAGPAVAASSLAGKGFQCQDPQAVLGGTTNFTKGGQVQIRVACTINVSDLGFLSLPWPTKRIVKSAVEPLDYYMVFE